MVICNNIILLFLSTSAADCIILFICLFRVVVCICMQFVTRGIFVFLHTKLFVISTALLHQNTIELGRERGGGIYGGFMILLKITKFPKEYGFPLWENHDFTFKKCEVVPMLNCHDCTYIDTTTLITLSVNLEC